MDISFKKDSGGRGAYRAKIEGLHVKIDGRPAVYAATDLSPTGVGLDGWTGMKKGQKFEVNLFFKGAMVVSSLKTSVVRVAGDFTGLLFVGLDRRQADAVHGLVLKEQKRQAEIRMKDRTK